MVKLANKNKDIISEVNDLVASFRNLRTPTTMATNQSEVTGLILSHLRPLQAKIDELTGTLANLSCVNTVSEYQTQEINDSIRCDETLDVIKSLPNFDGKNSYVSWREAANNSMKLYKRGSRKYFAALTILRNKIVDEANDILTNHGTVLNLEAIISRLDFAFADKRPLHIVEQELSVMRQGSLSIIDYYNEVNKKLTALINKTIMSHGSESELTKELNNKNRQYALRVFVTGLNAPLANVLFSLSPKDLPNALAKAQELESNNIRANFAFQFNRAGQSNYNNQKYTNLLRFPRRNQNNPQINYVNARHPEPKPEPMELGSSVNVKPPQNFYNNKQPNYFYNSQNRTSFSPQGSKRPHSRTVYQPNHKTQRINNLNEDTFLETGPSCPTSLGQQEMVEKSQF